MLWLGYVGNYENDRVRLWAEMEMGLLVMIMVINWCIVMDVSVAQVIRTFTFVTGQFSYFVENRKVDTSDGLQNEFL